MAAKRSNAIATAKKLATHGATEGERLAAQSALARLSDTDQATIRPSLELRLRRTKPGTGKMEILSVLATSDAIKHFVKEVKGGESITYRDVAHRHCSTNDYYAICDTLISLGVARKEGSKYHISKSYREVFASWYNQQIDSMRI